MRDLDGIDVTRAIGAGIKKTRYYIRSYLKTVDLN